MVHMEISLVIITGIYRVVDINFQFRDSFQ
jgi:hypothetical protein